VLIETSHPGNVGSTARAMKVMGFRDLILVRPRFADVLSQEETVAMASGAADILARARIVDRLEDALEGCTFVCATAMTPRDFGPPTRMPRELFDELARKGEAPGEASGEPPGEGATHQVAFLFGSERYGMSNEDVYRAHAVLSIPTHPEYGSLNLAQAVQLVAYDWRQALGGFAVEARTADPRLADARAVQGLLTHLESSLVHLGYLDPASPKKLMPRLNQLFNRAGLTQEEVHILRGIARAIEKTRPAAGTPPTLGGDE
jgi:tRNA/rRNA methyltransferase